MPTFLSDPPSAVFLILALVALIAGAVWSNRRSRKTLVAFVCVLGLIGVVLLIDFLVESPREQSVRRAQAMVKAADARDPETFVTHVADKVEFDTTGGALKTLTRDEIRKSPFWGMLQAFNARIVAWDFALDGVGDANTLVLGFMAKGEANGQIFPAYLRATFTRQADGQFKITRVASFNPLNHQEKLVIPGFP